MNRPPSWRGAIPRPSYPPADDPFTVDHFLRDEEPYSVGVARLLARIGRASLTADDAIALHCARALAHLGQAFAELRAADVVTTKARAAESEAVSDPTAGGAR